MWFPPRWTFFFFARRAKAERSCTRKQQKWNEEAITIKNSWSSQHFGGNFAAFFCFYCPMRWTWKKPLPAESLWIFSGVMWTCLFTPVYSLLSIHFCLFTPVYSLLSIHSCLFTRTTTVKLCSNEFEVTNNFHGLLQKSVITIIELKRNLCGDRRLNPLEWGFWCS